MTPILSGRTVTNGFLPFERTILTALTEKKTMTRLQIGAWVRSVGFKRLQRVRPALDQLILLGYVVQEGSWFKLANGAHRIRGGKWCIEFISKP